MTLVQDNKLGISQTLLSTGVVGVYDLTDNDSVRIVIEGANPGNVIQIRMRLQYQTSWTDIRTVNGSKSEVLKTDTYDFMQVECTTLDGTNVHLSASGFRNGA